MAFAPRVPMAAGLSMDKLLVAPSVLGGTVVAGSGTTVATSAGNFGSVGGAAVAGSGVVVASSAGGFGSCGGAAISGSGSCAGSWACSAGSCGDSGSLCLQYGSCSKSSLAEQCP